MKRSDCSGFTDGNGADVREGDTVEWADPATRRLLHPKTRRGVLLTVMQDGDAMVRFRDSGILEGVKWKDLCLVSTGEGVTYMADRRSPEERMSPIERALSALRALNYADTMALANLVHDHIKEQTNGATTIWVPYIANALAQTPHPPKPAPAAEPGVSMSKGA